MPFSSDSDRLYIMLSRTDTRMGQLIRLASRYSYNHVSMTLDPDLSSWVSFARYARNFPLYGGFIRELPRRYLETGQDPQVEIFQLDITPRRRKALEALFALSDSPEHRLIYNTYDALATAVGLRIRLPNAYTCLSFACAVLDVQARSIRELDAQLRPYRIYQGPFSALVDANAAGYGDALPSLGLLRGSWYTARHFASLTGRIFRRNSPEVITKYLQ